MNVNSRIARANFTGFASGAIASFTGLREAPIKVRSYINAIQEGFGDPSPDNVRPIIGRDNITITANSVDHNISLDDSVYGGSLDVTTGVLTVDRQFAIFDGTENWVNVGGQYPYAFQLDTYIPNIKSSPISSQNILCNMFVQTKVEVPTGDAIRWQVNTQTGRLYVYCHQYSGDLAGFKAMLAENNLQVCYNLATPITVQLTPTQVEQIIGTNNIFSDSENVEVYYVTI